MKLSEYLKSWRAERPDEWTMDEFIRKAEKLEKLCDKHFVYAMVQPYAGAVSSVAPLMPKGYVL